MKSIRRLLEGSVVLHSFALLSPLCSAQSVQLSAPLSDPGSDVVRFGVDPAGTHAFYVADEDVLGVFELHCVPIDASSPAIELSGAMPATGDVVGEFRVSALGWVVYRADPDVDDALELFSAPIDGSQPPVRLCPLLAPGRDVELFDDEPFKLSPDGTRVVYVADQDTDEVRELFVAPVDGSAPAQKLHAPFVGQDIVRFFLDPTSTKVLYSTQAFPGPIVNELYAVALDGLSPPVHLATHLFGTSSQEGIYQLAFSPDGTWAAYNYLWNAAGFPGFKLLIVPVDGSLASRLINDGYGVEPQFVADGTRCVYRYGSPYVLGVDRLYSATLTGPSVLLDQTGLDVSKWRLGPDGATVFFAHDQGVSRVPADHGAPHTLLSAGVPSTYEGFQVGPDGQRVAFVVRPTDQLDQLRSVPTDGGTTRTLAPTPPGEQFWNFAFSPNARFVVYDARMSVSVHELFAAHASGSGTPRRINDALPPGGTVQWDDDRKKLGFAIVDDQVLYIASQDASGLFELFKAPLEIRSDRWRRTSEPPVPTVR